MIFDLPYQSIIWSEVVESAGHRNLVFVSGPQRSGTRYTAVTISNSLRGYDCIQSGKFVRYSTRGWPYFGSTDKKVIHCPDVSHKLHQLKDAKNLVIWMVRII